jgi:hypothetical protein
MGLAMLLAASSAGLAAEETPSRFDAALAKAKENQATPAGAAYDEVFGHTMSSQLGPSLAKCFTRTENPDVRKWDMLIRLDDAGNIAEVLLKPETNVGLCFKPSLVRTRFPAPPGPDWWVHVDMDITR